MAITILTSANFDQVLQANELLVIDFWAQWCGPCKGFSRVMTEVSAEYPSVIFASVDVEQEKDLAEEFAIRSVPFVMIVRSQVVVYAESGALPASELRRLLDEAKSIDQTRLRELSSEEHT